MTRRPSNTDLSHAATGPWASRAACANQPAYTDQDPDIITVTCRACRAAADCAKLGRLELARALGDKSDRGEQRVYAGHQLRDLLLLARRDTAGRKAAYQALVPLIDFPDQTCTACSGEHPGAPCPQEALPL